MNCEGCEKRTDKVIELCEDCAEKAARFDITDHERKGFKNAILGAIRILDSLGVIDITQAMAVLMHEINNSVIKD